MAAYVVVDIRIHDHKAYDEYKSLTPASIAAYGGRFAVRNGERECLEGDWNPERLVILEFPTMEQAKRWWNSPEYAPAKAIRQSSADTDMLLIEGFEGFK